MGFLSLVSTTIEPYSKPFAKHFPRLMSERFCRQNGLFTCYVLWTPRVFSFDFRKYARESNGIHLLIILRTLLSGELIRSLLKTHKNHLRKIPIERCVVLESIKKLKFKVCGPEKIK